MSIVKTVADFFRSASGKIEKPLDRYGILAPIMAANDYTVAALDYFELLVKDQSVISLLSGREKTTDQYRSKAIDTYREFLRGLSPHEKSMEHKAPLSSIIMALKCVLGNLDLIEDNFEALFENLVGADNEDAVRSSTLVAIGYIESADSLATWVGRFAWHLTHKEGDSIPPFWTKGIAVTARSAGMFVSDNLNKWNPSHKGLIDDIRAMQKKGIDVAVRSGDNWMDEFVHDNQFTDSEQALMVSALANPIIAWVNNSIVRKQEQIALAEAKKDWLISKIAQQEALMNGTDPASPEYTRIVKASDYYTAQVTKYEQKIERMRA